MTIKDLGARVADVWEGLRPVTRRMIVGALQSGGATNSPNINQSFSYDAHSDWELSRLLDALDERAAEGEARKNPENLRELRRMANACAGVLAAQTESAEIFIQLATRALLNYDYARLDSLAGSLNERFSAAEICEIVRQSDSAAIRALAFEALAMVPVLQLLPLIDDPLYEEIARAALEQQAIEFESEEARQVLEQLAIEDFLGE